MKQATCRGISKQFIARGRRRDGEVYGAVIDRRAGGQAAAFLAVHEQRERLMIAPRPDAPARALTQATYVLSPCFVGGNLAWVERVGADWRLRSIPCAPAATAAEARTPLDLEGRPLSLSACEAEDLSVLVWEERQGKRTRVRMSLVSGEDFGEAVDITDGHANAYDPACCFTSAGDLVVVYATFRDGQYIVERQVFDRTGKRLSGAARISNQVGPCLYPSVCARPQGGIWFTYTGFGDNGGGETTFVQHHRYRAQQRCFATAGTVYCGILDGEGRLWAPLTPPQPQDFQGPVAAMIVPGSADATRSHVFTDAHGGAHILLRQHRSGGEPAYASSDAPLSRAENGGIQHDRNNHPSIALISLQDLSWSAPQTLISRAYLDGPVSFNTDGQTVNVAFQQDSRHTGWSRSGEWFDRDGQLGVGVARIELGTTRPPREELRAFHLAPCPPPSIEDPRIPPAERDGLRAVVGQTHTHSNLSICVRSGDRDIDFNYRFTQDVQHSDFCAITDHAYNMWHTEMLLIRKMAEYYYFPGDFVAIPAYEWTGSTGGITHEGGPWGHVNPLYLEEDGDLEFYTPCDPDHEGGSLQRTWQCYKGLRIVTPPHHVADQMHFYNWDFFDPTFEPVIELFQDSRGSGEQPRVAGVTNNSHQEQGHWAADELLKGRRFGFIASADHTGIARAGLWVKDLSRTGLYDAFMARRVFGVTALRMNVDFTCEGRFMGAEVAAEGAVFRLAVQAPEPILEFQIVRNAQTVQRVPVKEGTGTRVHEWRVDRHEPNEFWYARIILRNGEMAWTSPIWLT